MQKDTERRSFKILLTTPVGLFGIKYLKMNIPEEKPTDFPLRGWGQESDRLFCQAERELC